MGKTTTDGINQLNTVVSIQANLNILVQYHSSLNKWQKQNGYYQQSNTDASYNKYNNLSNTQNWTYHSVKGKTHAMSFKICDTPCVQTHTGETAPHRVYHKADEREMWWMTASFIITLTLHDVQYHQKQHQSTLLQIHFPSSFVCVRQHFCHGDSG